MDSKLAVLEYHDNFADNFSTYAYGKILQTRYSYNCVYANSPKEREKFEDCMDNFNLDYNFISKSRVDKILRKSKKNAFTIDNYL